MTNRIILHQPEIAPNTGNVIRLAANTGFELHLIEPLGFELDDRRLKRAGLDYHEYASLETHASWASYLESAPADQPILAFSRHASTHISDVDLSGSAALLFGSETKGLPEKLRASFPNERLVRLPMQANSRSLNLSNAVAVATYEAWRQQGFAGAAQPGEG